MQTIEIRQNTKAILIVTVVVTGTGIIISCCYLLFETFTYLKFFYALVIAALMLYIANKLLSSAQKNLPLLILSKDTLEINDYGKITSFSWAEITYYDIVTDDATEYLIVKSSNNSIRINISFLEKKSNEVKNLISEYKAESHLESLNNS